MIRFKAYICRTCLNTYLRDDCMLKIDIKSKLREYRRVVQIARKPDKEEFLVSAKISSIGLLVIGGIGFLIFMVFIFAGI